MKSGKIKEWTKYVEVESHAREQISNVASLSIVYPHVAIMPDVHYGKGATVGTVIPTKNAIIPAAVGVDIGCGMIAVCLDLFASQLPNNLKGLRINIEEAVPVGRAAFDPDKIPLIVKYKWQNDLLSGYLQVLERNSKIGSKSSDVAQLGTLGSGNHFIEICLDEHQQVWVMVHTGSRGIGNRIGSNFIELAKKDMGEMLGSLPDEDLAYLRKDTEIFDDYIFSISWAQKYAAINREIIVYTVIDQISKYLKISLDLDNVIVDCHHNYVSQETHFGEELYITRKGAISAKKGEMGIIPGNMGAKSFIVNGLGNKDSFNSCSHGAGRIMSRSNARKLISMEDHENDTKGIECRKDEKILDESPRAYKNINDVMKSQEDLVDILYTLNQLLNVKG